MLRETSQRSVVQEFGESEDSRQARRTRQVYAESIAVGSEKTTTIKRMAHKKSKRLEKTNELLFEEHESRETLPTADSLNTETSVATARSSVGSQEIANTS